MKYGGKHQKKTKKSIIDNLSRFKVNKSTILFLDKKKTQKLAVSFKDLN